MGLTEANMKGKRGGSPGFRRFRMLIGLPVFLLATVCTSGFLLMLNSALVFAIYSRVQGSTTGIASSPQLWQFFVYAAPVVMLMGEWSIWDRFADRYLYRR